ncbi:MAG: heme ABC exporter ATP-binding protein CcmA [Actinobacteria bacterium]|nr:heme ABC exporter ATP-binding protein CcmA [Actinomycetota bacterium]
MSFVDAVIAYDNFPAVAGATFSVDSGEIILLQGPNGAGKTTLLRACAGLLPIARGNATVLGVDLKSDRATVRSQVGLLGHSNGLYQDLTVAENIGFWSRLVGAGNEDIAQAMRLMGLSERLSAVKISNLSAGQRRRCALATLIVRRARLWLLDEPHAGLDAQGRDELDKTLRSARDAGATVVFASHEIDRAQALATRRLKVTSGVVSEA